MRKRIVIGNWKMYLSLKESIGFACQLQQELKTLPEKIEVVICPAFTALPSVQPFLTTLQLGAQDCCWEEKGPFTGEISAAMLYELGCRYVIIGHSERRAHVKETDEVINKKIKTALNNMLTPILCVGETDKQKEEGFTDYAVMQQVKACLEGIRLIGKQQLIIAYEPIWAIGSGRTVRPDEPDRVHRVIRQTLLDFWPADMVKTHVRTVYGGSVDPRNVLSFTDQGAEDGVLVGGASLKLEDFIRIIKRVAI